MIVELTIVTDAASIASTDKTESSVCIKKHFFSVAAEQCWRQKAISVYLLGSREAPQNGASRVT